MPKVTHLQTNFTAGEISPKLYGRVDISKYGNGAKKLRDCIVQIWGGAKRRDGTLFVKEVKTSAKKTRLVPFIYNEDTAYMLEFGDLYMRVFKTDGTIVGPGAPAAYNGGTAYVVGDLASSGGVNYYCIAPTTGNAPPNATYWYAMPEGVYEIPTPYTEALLFDMDYTQGADTMFLFQETIYPRRLRRFGETNWQIEQIPFVETPFLEPGTYPAATLTPTAATPVGAACTLNASAGVFAAGDIGSSVKINGGIVKITSFTSNVQVAGVIKQVLTSTAAAPANSWSLHAQAWTAGNGYPRTGTLYEQRLIVAGSTAYPQTMWGSATGAYLDFTMGVADDDAFAFTIASEQINPIQFIASSRALTVFTSGGEFTVFGGLEKPLAPTNVQIRQRSNYGCARVRPVRIREAEMFVQRAGQKVRAFAYNVVNDDWTAGDISVLSEHLTVGGFVEMCWQQEPTSIIWLVRADGVPVSVTYDKDQDVIGWAAHTGFTGIAESVATMPDATGDQVWMVVKRTINGNVKRYIERFDKDTRMDCAKHSTAGTPATVWTGFDHLEGQEIDVVGDSAYSGRYPVSGGQITTSKAYSDIRGGLPFENRVELLDPEIQTGMGSSSGNSMRTSEVTVRVHETTGCNVNGKPLIFREFGTNTTVQTPQPFTGVKRLENLGWERGESPLAITQDVPMPFHLLSVTRKLTVNDG